MSVLKDPIDRIIESTYDFGRFMRHQMMSEMHGQKPVNFLQMHALFIISESEGMTMKALAKALHISSPSATSLANRLVRMQWVTRLHDTANRKLVRLRMTPLGKKILREKNDRRREVLRRVFSFLTPSEQAQLARLHEKLSSKLHLYLHSSH
jgi:DNA-binding MarR family transcriptional regulator